jgi:hypothetical protein
MNTPLRSFLAAGLATFALCTTAAPAADAPAKIKVLLITGDDVAPAHNWKETTAATREVLEASGRFEVKVSEEAGVLDSAATLKRHDVVYLNLYNAKTPTLSDQAKANLLDFVKAGKGFVVTHLSSASFKEWDEFKKLCGRYWVMGKSGHGPRSTFKVTVKDPNHPIATGVSAFETDDELYAKLLGDEPVQVILEAYSDWSKNTEPLAFVKPYGEGRVFHHTFGHDGKAVKHPPVAKVIVQGTEWAATGKVQ